ncbi:isochorismatase family protein [Salinicola avicenniae]|uniref:isochorismatase family protein n=1 Tax=Salinicola avicenniae TaxID=2916836 RepID=UPI002074610B|nr:MULTISPECIES: isochorismatase family protein [unclassified Salinicola]
MRHDRATGGPQGAARLDPGQVQVLFADLQGKLPENSRTVAPTSMAETAAGLAKIADLLGLPMCHSVAAQAGMDPTIIAPLAPYANEENTYPRVTAGALMDASTRQALAAAHRPVLIVAGFAAEVVVLQTVLDAVAEGYTVFYAVDAIGALSARTEQAVFRQMDAVGAMPASVASLAARLAPDFDRAPGTDVLEVMLSLPHE